MIVTKSDAVILSLIEKATDVAIEASITMFGGKRANKAALKLPLCHGDLERGDDAYTDANFVKADSLTRPQIVDENVSSILNRAEVYSGCYARVSLSFYAFNTDENKKVACGLASTQKIRYGDSLGWAPACRYRLWILRPD
ncbi:DUF2815 family protein [Corynebacterium sp. CCM 9185]|uniref:ssDNA-binding protein n=1 Tax=Corynebacterium marambiense TaxID=2765364 RepID=UPI001E573CA2|nr:ssDNA-binding protein [Corynebacterium marambiense]MCK7662055.1 DUF2815 family protein [Corynebacterium marambiense]